MGIFCLFYIFILLLLLEISVDSKDVRSSIYITAIVPLKLPGVRVKGVAGSANLVPNPLADHAYVATHGEIFCRPIINVGSPGPFVK
jgi:hypothetical protein